MNRRKFFTLTANGSLAFLTLRLATACGVDESARILNAAAPADTVQMQDIEMEGWSLNTGTMLGSNGTLKASTIRDRKKAKLEYVQDDDGHTFTLEAEHFEKLIKGEVVKIKTTTAANHEHLVVIDPSNVVAGSTPIAIPVIPPAATSSEKLYAALDDEAKGEVYVAGSTELDEASVQYCAAPADKCDSEESLWTGMKRYGARTDKQIFVSDKPLALDVANAEYPFSVRAKVKSDGKLARLIAKIVRK